MRLHQTLLCTLGLTLLTLPIHAQWTPPTPEELSMTSQAQVPGAPAVYLYREEMTNDENHSESVYVRIKVLTERGKEYGTIDLPYDSGGHAHVEVTDISGRTIHADGTIIPFTGKPFNKLIQKTRDSQVQAKVFSLPDIQVGSILEYRYHVRYEDNYFISPSWYIQSNLFTRKAHYQWKPTSRELVSSDDRGTISNSVAWYPILPTGTSVKLTTYPAIGNTPARNEMNLDVANIDPTPDEEFLPPLTSTTMRVLFYYTPYSTDVQYWTEEGKHWSKLADKFIGPGPAVRAAVAQLAPDSATPIEKLRKIYSTIMTFENTDFTRERTSAEERANGARDIHTTDDVLTRKRGSGDQLTRLFVAMARAAGLKAYLAAVTDRDRGFFIKGYLTFRQLDDDLAIVNIDGKDHFFDPGQRYMPFEHLAWKHTLVSGLRQTDKGVTFAEIPGENYNAAKFQRIADLTLDKDGEAAGTVRLTYIGGPAAYWRQQALLGDSTSFQHDMVENCERLLGKSMEVKVASIAKLTDYEDPLTVTFNVKGPIATGAGSRMLIASDLFEAQSTPDFTSKERKFPIFFHYPNIVQDVIHIKLPAGVTVESIPKTATTRFQSAAAYSLKVEQTADTYTIRRDFVLGNLMIPQEQYPEFRTFYNGFETQDREPVVLKASTTATN